MTAPSLESFIGPSELLLAGRRQMLAVEMSEAWDELGDDERRVICYLAKRLLDGQKQYGKIDLASDKRDWVKEQRAEIGDLLVYSAFEALKGA